VKYKFNHNKPIIFTSGANLQTLVDIRVFKNAIENTHFIVDKIVDDIPVDIFSILGMRNLSAFIGEVYVKSFEEASDGLFISNPHQDGYPDLLLLDQVGRDTYTSLQKKGQLQSKAPFSPFKNGGIEVKATVGSVPTPKECAKKNIVKPHLGDTRIDVLKGYDWKAHHRETNNLIGILWDFIDNRPRIVALFCCTLFLLQFTRRGLGENSAT
jgi:hypothetical protein